MNVEIEEKIASVLNAQDLGGTATSYKVHHTAESVMLVFGLFPGQHRDAMRELISRQNDRWIESAQIAQITGAEFVMGAPDCIERLKNRLRKAGVDCHQANS